MSLQIKRLDADSWAVFDESDTTLFTGSLNACRQWLDDQENASPKQRSGIRDMVRSLLRFLTLARFRKK